MIMPVEPDSNKCYHFRAREVVGVFSFEQLVNLYDFMRFEDIRFTERNP